MDRPLADRIRPQTLEEVVGQRHLLGPDALLRRFIEKGTDANMVFYGPSGTGKTTIANIIARQTHRTLYRLNATTASLQDIKDIIGEVGTLMAPGGVLLYLDEIQYFNKKQQQSLLEFMENGSITLIASTTENPYFYVYAALLSRSTVFEFKPVTAADVRPAVDRALDLVRSESPLPLSWEEGVPDYVAQACGGDVRKAMNAVELLYEAASVQDGALTLTLSDARQVSQRSAMRYDRGGDAMYDMASALMKSLRGSDPDAALHYLARFLEAGDLITPCRRLLCSASEDVGLAYPQAVSIVKSCVDTAMQLGLPEAQLPLAQAAILLATAPKSNSVVNAIGAAMADVRAAGSSTITVEGGRALSGGEYTVMGDRIVAATLLSAAASAGGRVRLRGVDWRHLSTVLSVFHQAGCRVESRMEYVELERNRELPLKGVPTIRTAPYPGFPTDAQAPVMAALAASQGCTLFVETMFDSRYRHVDELRRMGADISVADRVAVVTGVPRLCGASVRATDLRGGAALLVAGLAAEGVTRIGDIHHIQRGYEDPVRDLGLLGARITLEEE